jgi:transcriptional regulator with XRE-family HTH domain
MTFKEKLVILRKMKGLTQDDFASAVGVSRQAVYKWECGQSYPEVPKLIEMKLLFGISLDNLLDDSYDIPLPEKKKRKRISKEAKQEIEANIVKEEKPAPAPKAAAPAPKAAPAAPKAAAPAPKAEPVAPKAEPVAPKAEPTSAAEPVAAPEAVEVKAAPAPKAEPQVAVKEEAPKAEEAKDIKKGGFFSKLFGKK